MSANNDILDLMQGQSEQENELAQLRADLQAAQERIAQLEAALAFSDSEKDQRIAEQARQLDKARKLLTTLEWNDWDDRVDAWLSANPAPPIDGNQTASLADYPLLEDRVP